jgi:hypothetical protein
MRQLSWLFLTLFLRGKLRAYVRDCSQQKNLILKRAYCRNMHDWNIPLFGVLYYVERNISFGQTEE